MEWARREYGAVSTFAAVDGPNRISILLQGDSDLPEECELNAPRTAPSTLGRKSMSIPLMLSENPRFDPKESECMRILFRCLRP